jgi:hypothetical protein
MTNNQESKKSGSKRGLIIAFIIILLAINGVQLWLNLSKTEDIEKKDMTITEQKARIDSTTTELDKVIKDLEAKKQELAKLGADTTRMSEAITKLIEERNKYAKESRFNQIRYQEILVRIEEANRLRDIAETEVVKWKNYAALLDSTNRKLKVEKEYFIDSLKKLNYTQAQLVEKVAVASVLKAENLRFEAISNKGRVKEGDEFRAKSLEKLRVIFSLGENKIAKIEKKIIFLRIIEPDGSALFDNSTGGGTFIFEEKEIPYTDKREILFDNKKPEIAFNYFKGSPYKPGKYTIELYADNFNIGTGSFEVK